MYCIHAFFNGISKALPMIGLGNGPGGYGTVCFARRNLYETTATKARRMGPMGTRYSPTSVMAKKKSVPEHPHDRLPPIAEASNME